MPFLRKKASARFKFDIHSLSVTLTDEQFVTDGHLYLRDKDQDLATINPILPNPSQQSIKRVFRNVDSSFSLNQLRRLDGTSTKSDCRHMHVLMCSRGW
ncbi:hypothetical protein CY34DRAFT_812859 [Suillus luteus UH-Slu-Lm8-n1]|uniref:Unplaced genomic scaffold CY34scaffold_617, whole genome shotgun sequence n=1 Tax=Suillus luteus UH-Slu-Lm8-n1 TaxID=930992 RepID=A0A0D0AJR7_9AGAM|nr:hypothetical protein CY34DRAFT_812859 [Suillus luteus UH-Slu-Lm8-n1]